MEIIVKIELKSGKQIELSEHEFTEMKEFFGSFNEFARKENINNFPDFPNYPPNKQWVSFPEIGSISQVNPKLEEKEPTYEEFGVTKESVYGQSKGDIPAK